MLLLILSQLDVLEYLFVYHICNMIQKVPGFGMLMFEMSVLTQHKSIVLKYIALLSSKAQILSGLIVV